MIKSISQQLTDIYINEEDWHLTKMSEDDAFRYHKTRLESGNIKAFTIGNDVVSYYERYFVGNICVLHNLWVRGDMRKSEVFRQMSKHFFTSMPDHIKFIIGEKQKDNAKVKRHTISDWRKRNGFNKNRTEFDIHSYAHS